MLEGYTGERGPRARRLGPAAIFSIAAHLVAVVALLIGASWRIDKLTYANPTVYLTAGLGNPLPDPGEGAAPAPVTRPHVVKKPRRVRELAQPEPAPPVDVLTAEEPTRDEGRVAAQAGAGLNLLGSCAEGSECVPAGLLAMAETPLCGNGVVEPGEECDDGGRVNHDGCSATCAKERTVLVESRVIEGYRIAGDPQIHAPESVRDRMEERGESRAVGIVQMCLGADGVPSTLRLYRSTGYKEYDSLLTSRMRSWRYRPYRLSDGTPVNACTMVAFIYRMEIRASRRERPMVH
jgi:cysteine-rich repeat protein